VPAPRYSKSSTNFGLFSFERLVPLSVFGVVLSVSLTGAFDVSDRAFHVFILKSGWSPATQILPGLPGVTVNDATANLPSVPVTRALCFVLVLGIYLAAGLGKALWFHVTFAAIFACLSMSVWFLWISNPALPWFACPATGIVCAWIGASLVRLFRRRSGGARDAGHC